MHVTRIQMRPVSSNSSSLYIPECTIRQVNGTFDRAVLLLLSCVKLLTLMYLGMRGFRLPIKPDDYIRGHSFIT